MDARNLTTGRIAEMVGGSLRGPADRPVARMEALDRAGPADLSFISSPRYAAAWRTSGAGAALAERSIEVEPIDGRAIIVVDNVDLAVAKVLEALAPPAPRPEEGAHPLAAVDPSAKIGPGARIGPHCTVGPNTVIGEGAVLHASVTILADCRIGAGCVLWPGVVIRERCELGDGCVLHPNVTIGSDGFGYRSAADGSGLVKVPQIGTVRIGRGVEIGAGTCVDRGKFSATEIGDGTKIDNLVQIAHNCRIGRAVLIAGCVGIAGSVTIGDGVAIGGGAIVRDHATIGPGAQVMGFAGVMSDVPAGTTWGGYAATEARAAARERAALRKLPDLLGKLRKAAR